MPIYAYSCRACGHQFDRLQKLSDPDPEVCPECGAAQVRRQVTAPVFRLVGSGWYETDFKKDGDRRHNLANATDPGKKGESVGSAAATTKGERPVADGQSGKAALEKSVKPASGAPPSGAAPN